MARKRTALARSAWDTVRCTEAVWIEMFTWLSHRFAARDAGSFRVPLALDQLHDQWRQDELHGEVELRSMRNDRVRARHETVRKHRQQIGKVDAARVLEADHHHRFVRRRNPARDERI